MNGEIGPSLGGFDVYPVIGQPHLIGDEPNPALVGIQGVVFAKHHQVGKTLGFLQVDGKICLVFVFDKIDGAVQITGFEALGLGSHSQ